MTSFAPRSPHSIFSVPTKAAHEIHYIVITISYRSYDFEGDLKERNVPKEARSARRIIAKTALVLIGL